MTYKIVRHFADREDGVMRRTIRSGLSLEDAQEWCGWKETSSRTCTSWQKRQITRRYGPWFDGYTEEGKT